MCPSVLLGALSRAPGNPGDGFLSGENLLPTLSALMILLVLVLGLRAVLGRSTEPQRYDKGEVREVGRRWWRRFGIPMLLAMGGSIWLMPKRPDDACILLIAISTLALLGFHASLSRAGLATRRAVWAVAMFMAIPLVAGALAAMGGWLHLDRVLAGLVPGVFVLGLYLCAYLESAGRSPRMGFAEAWVLLTVGVPFIWIAVVPQLFPENGEATAADVRSWLSSLGDDDAPYDLLQQGEHLERTVTNFLAAGEAPFDLQALENRARKQLDQDPLFVHSSWALDFARLGFFTDEDYERLDHERAMDELLSSKANFGALPGIELAILDRLRLGSFTSEERTLIADKVIAILNLADRGARQAAVNIIHILDHLELSARSTELAPTIDRILRATWVRGDWRHRAGFLPYGGDNSGNVDAVSPGYTLQDRDMSSSIWLMGRFGVPDWLSASDLGALDAFMGDWSEYPLGSRWNNTRGPLNFGCSEAASARALLHTLPGWKAAESMLPKQSNVLRVLIAYLLMAAFSVILTWRASQETPAA